MWCKWKVVIFCLWEPPVFPGTPWQRTKTLLSHHVKGISCFALNGSVPIWLSAEAVLCPGVTSGLCLPASSSGFPPLNVPKWNTERLLPTPSQRDRSSSESCRQTRSGILGVFSLSRLACVAPASRVAHSVSCLPDETANSAECHRPEKPRPGSKDPTEWEGKGVTDAHFTGAARVCVGGWVEVCWVWAEADWWTQ